MDDNAEEWLATEDPTEGDLPTTEFIGSTKDLSQSVDPVEGDGEEIAEVPERANGEPTADEEPAGVLSEDEGAAE